MLYLIDGLRSLGGHDGIFRGRMSDGTTLEKRLKVALTPSGKNFKNPTGHTGQNRASLVIWWPMNLRKLFPLLLMTLILGVSSQAISQVVVYKVKFEKTGESLNYESYEGGFFVTNFNDSIGNVILTITDGAFRYYVEVEEAGELFLIRNEGKRVAVFRASGTNANGVTVSYQAIGKVKRSVKIGGGYAAPIARKLEGYLLASASERDAAADDESNDEFDETVGFAGSSEIAIRFDADRTREYNERLFDVSDATDALIAELEQDGYDEEPEDGIITDPSDLPDTPLP
jgi:hypothetical protein